MPSVNKQTEKRLLFYFSNMLLIISLARIRGASKFVSPLGDFKLSKSDKSGAFYSQFTVSVEL
jgi:hypothetical protein